MNAQGWPKKPPSVAIQAPPAFTRDIQKSDEARSRGGTAVWQRIVCVVYNRAINNYNISCASCWLLLFANVGVGVGALAVAAVVVCWCWCCRGRRRPPLLIVHLFSFSIIHTLLSSLYESLPVILLFSVVHYRVVGICLREPGTIGSAWTFPGACGWGSGRCPSLAETGPGLPW